MKVIITMAGEGARFRKVGFKEPKFKLVVQGKAMFDWALSTLENFYQYPFVFVARKEHNCRKFIEGHCKSLGIKEFHVKEIDYLTKGQAATVLEAGEFIEDSDEILVYNIDNYVDPKALHPEQIRGDGWVPAIELEGDKWSFVECDKNGNVSRVTEKDRISPYASIGLYYFKSYALYKRVYEQKDLHNLREEYIAPLYNGLIRQGLKVTTTIVPSDSMRALGTPEDILAFWPEFKKQIDAVAH